ncbi:MAG: S-layer homology domain-containing protein [Intestinimonas sp.]|nr:S-layer homology domain-containing protein [Intestinimonas sp.]
MKRKQFLACMLAAALTLTLAALPASAVTFPDISSHWAKSYIEKMTEAGMFKGYDDGTFRPDNQLTASEALALCARTVGLNDDTASQIASDRKDEVDGILNGSQSWFYSEFAICLETGIISDTELKSLVQTGTLTQPITKEELSRYLVRAMQLGPMADHLTSYGMSFTDTASISQSDRPYVYLLNIYGIVQGDTDNAFGPKGDVTRAIMATMLSRAIAFMDERGISVDLPEYTDYKFKQGIITSADTGSSGITVLTLKGDLSGETMTVSLPSGVAVYENNMSATTSALTEGKHVRVCLNSSEEPYAVRLDGTLTSYTADLNDIDGNNVSVTLNGTSEQITMNRFTQVQLGSKTIGDRSIVDDSADYTSVVYQLDEQDNLVTIRFLGGTVKQPGFLSDITNNSNGSTTVLVRMFDGITRQYTIPADASVLVDNMAGSLSTAQEDKYVLLRISNEDGTVTSVNVDTDTDYVQGTVSGKTYQNTTSYSLTMKDWSTGKTHTYTLASGARVYYNGTAIRFSAVEKGWFLTAQLSSGKVDCLNCYPGETTVEGTLTARTFGTGDDSNLVMIQVTGSNGTVYSFQMDLTDMPTIKRGSSTSSIDRLRLGDSLEVTLDDGEVDIITASFSGTTVKGTIQRITQESGGNSLDILLTDGSQVTYSMDSLTTVTQNGKEVSFDTLKPGYTISMQVSGDYISEITVQQGTDDSTTIDGTVVYINTSDKTILLRSSSNDTLVTINVTSSTNYMEWNGTKIYFSSLAAGDWIQINGSYSGTEFNASLILRHS